MRKDKGDTFNSILPNFICIIVTMVLVILFTSWIANITNRQNINQVCRQYILRMETTGYLTNEMEVELKNKLQDIGLQNIQIDSETTKSKVEYGDDVDLVVTGKFPVFEYTVNRETDGKVMKLNDSIGYWDVRVSKSSTSLAK